MRFKVGDLVKVVWYNGICEKEVLGKLAVIKEKSDSDYGLHIQGFGDIWWFSAGQLELVASSQRETFKQYCKRMFNLVTPKKSLLDYYPD